MPTNDSEVYINLPYGPLGTIDLSNYQHQGITLTEGSGTAGEFSFIYTPPIIPKDGEMRINNLLNTIETYHAGLGVWVQVITLAALREAYQLACKNLSERKRVEDRFIDISNDIEGVDSEKETNHRDLDILVKELITGVLSKPVYYITAPTSNNSYSPLDSVIYSTSNNQIPGPL